MNALSEQVRDLSETGNKEWHETEASSAFKEEGRSSVCVELLL